jgi:2-dehydropantoate 2-reductase
MRFVVFGVGAIGGTVAASLALSGREVIGIARGAQLAAINADGLLLRTPETATRANFPCYGDPADVNWRADDVVFLTMKTQDTESALQRLRAAGVSEQPIFCAQNGVANERLALRLFANVYGVTVMMPASYAVPGEVNAFSAPNRGIFDVGRYPSGSDAVARQVVAALEAARIAAFGDPEVMAGKHGKLLLNLRNVIEAALGVEGKSDGFYAAVREEGEAVYKAAGISWPDIGAADPRRDSLMRYQPIEGVARSGGSSTQSLARGLGSIETDYLNGEIVLLGRLHGVPTPANAYFCGLAQRMLREQMPPGAIKPAEIEAGLQQAGAGNQSRRAASYGRKENNMEHHVEILGTDPVTHNVRRYTVQKPAGYTFTPGQATDVSIDQYGWVERKSPFTFTALNDWPNLEFTIKSYFSHEGITNRLWELSPGERLILRDPWGTITYKGPGTFIAGGAGVTPFIAILRQLQKDGKLQGHRLIASHKTAEDIILRKEFEAMEGLQVTWTLTGDPSAEGVLHERIDAGFLKAQVSDFSQNFYLCGPDDMVMELRGTLAELGAGAESLTWEE